MPDPIQPEQCAQSLAALAAPERLRIVRLLSAGPRNVSEIAEHLGMALVNVSHHLSVLRHAGLLDKRKQGRFVVYSLSPGVFEPEGKSATKNRTHLDLATTSEAHQADLVARLRTLGATPADVGQGDVPWTVLADPEGNEFCVLEPREVYRDTGPIAAVVVDCADPRAMARFWGEATGWAPHEVTDAQASLRSPAGVGPYLEFVRTADAATVPMT